MQLLLLKEAKTFPADALSQPRSETLFVPFLGQVFDVQTRDEAELVAQASVDLRSADFALLSPREFERLLAAATDAIPEELAARLRVRTEAVRRGDF